MCMIMFVYDCECYDTLQYTRLVFFPRDDGDVFRHGVDFPVHSV